MASRVKKNCSALVCPQCHGSLLKSGSFMRCVQCSTDYPIVSHIPCFVSGTSAWQFSSREPTAEIIDIAKKLGWEKSLEKLDTERADWIRGAGRFTISVLAGPKRRVLDLGCGWGGLSFWLAKEFRHVFALDVKLDGLQFIDVRATQEGFHNIQTVLGSVFSLPFSDDFFDVVVLNGVLEWVGTFSEDEPPLRMQELALHEIARVIQPNGTLFLAIENRFGIQYFLGYKEEHTGLRYISILPRGLAQIYHRCRKGKDFRALTHSRQGLMGLLQNSRFYCTEWFSVYPSYRNCRYAGSLESTSALKFILRNFGAQTAFLPDILRKLLVGTLTKSSFMLNSQ
jgi:ubiquinone/menaquinone biosynthesis C-methylase UbiE